MPGSHTNAIEVRDVTKTYRIYDSSLARAADAFRRRPTGRTFMALDGVSLDFPKGEVIAIVGKNGSGKSTLLKIITGVTTATGGSVAVDGRVSAMLELTSGFDPELTGIENVYLKAVSMGIPRAEIEQRMAEIIAFADIGEHITQPVRTYSSGMKSRLGFAVSVNVDPDILIVDEVLAVGDDVFKLKCIDKMEEFRRQGKTILFVSHSLFTIKAFCTLGVWIDRGRVMQHGELGPVLLAYEDFLRAERARSRKRETESEEALAPQDKKDILEVTGFAMRDASGNKTKSFSYGDDIVFEFDYTVKRPIETLTFCYTIRNAEHLEVYMADKRNPRNVIDSSVGTHHLTVRLKSPNLLAGEYLLSGELWNNDAGLYVGYSNKRPFRIEQHDYLGTGITYVDYEFDNR
jgi:teichoic acid transport system ATP-binding protein